MIITIFFEIPILNLKKIIQKMINQKKNPEKIQENNLLEDNLLIKDKIE